MADIICRKNPLNGHAVVFVTDTLDYEGDKIKALNGADMTDVAFVTLSFYGSTTPISGAEEMAAIEKYRSVTGDQMPNIRHKLPRRHLVAKLNAAVPSPAPAPAPTPAPSGDVPEAFKGKSKKGDKKPDIAAAIKALRDDFNARLDAILQAA